MVMHVEFVLILFTKNVEHHDLRQMCKREQHVHVCILQSSKVQLYLQDVINVTCIIQKLNPLHLCMCNEQ